MSRPSFRSLSLLLCCFVFLASGCASMKYNYTPQATQADWPQLNQQTTVYVGEEMLIQGFIAKRKILDVKAMSGGTCYDIPPGLYPMMGEDDKNYYFSATGTGGSVVRAALCDPYSGVVVSKKDLSKVCVLTVYGAKSCYTALSEIREIETAHANGRQQSLIYSGLEGKKIKFTFVERQGANTTFSHNVSYDLNTSKTINYRGAQLGIHRADNERITYTVFKNFTDRR